MFKNMFFNVAAYVGLSASVAFSQHEARNYSQDSSRVNIPLTYTPHLVVNIANHDRKVSHLTEEEGINDIEKLVNSSEFEESWVFSPKDSLWTEIGFNETGWVSDSSGYSNGVTTDVGYLCRLMRANDTLKIYHFHPLKGYPKSSDDKNYAAIEKNVLTAIPSGEDLNMLVFCENLSNHLHRKIYMSSGVCSNLGTTQSSLTESSKKFLAGNDGKVGEGPSTMNFWIKDELARSNISTDTVEKTSTRLIHVLLSNLDNDYIKISFCPAKGFDK